MFDLIVSFLLLTFTKVRANAVIGMDPNNSYTPGSTITIGCAVQGYPKPNVTWIKDDLPIVSSERIQTTQSTY